MLAIILAAVLAAPVPIPFFVGAYTTHDGGWTGYDVLVQYRPHEPLEGEFHQSVTYAWPGGRLSDGAFIQNGMSQRWPDAFRVGVRAEAFAYCWPDAGEMDGEMTFINLKWTEWSTGTWGEWYRFTATLDGGVWTLAVTGPDGVRHVQYRYSNPNRLAMFEVEAETWTSKWDGEQIPGPFPTQAMRHIRVRTPAGAWVLPPMAATNPQGGRVTSRTPGNAVFAWAPEPQLYTLLWR